MKRLLVPCCLICLLVFTEAQDSPDREPNVVAGIDPATEVRLGTLWRDQTISKYQLSKNPEYLEAVNRVGRRIANAIGERPDLADDWEFTVLDSAVVNAFAFGGGKVVVFEGLLDKISKNNGGKPDENMLASVIGHEMAHNVRRHTLLGASTTGSMEWILTHLDAIEADAKEKLTPEEIARLRELARARFTRVQEFEADLLGALYATRAGFDGFNGAIRWMQMEANDPTQEYSMSEYLPRDVGSGQVRAADHPTWKERLAKLLEYKDSILNLAGEFNWGVYLLKTYSFEKAAECFKDVTKIFPDSFEAWNNLGVAYHWQYLRSAGRSEKFQPGLVDYFVQMRERVRGESPLNKAIRAYQQALRINPHAAGTQSNLATALIETHDPENLDDAEAILQKLLKTAPNDATYLNDLAILTYWKVAQSTGSPDKQSEAETLFAKAAAADYLPARYNLSVLQLETGKKQEGVAGLQEYLKKDAFSPWARLARELLKEQNAPSDDAPPPISPTALNVLNIRLGSGPEDVIKAVGNPERTEKAVTSEEDEGAILHYDDTLGLNVVLSNDKVVMIDIFAPQLPGSENALRPELAGIAIGASADELTQKLGQPTQIRPPDPNSRERAFFYLTKDSIVSFTVTPLRKVRVISVIKQT